MAGAILWNKNTSSEYTRCLGRISNPVVHRHRLDSSRKKNHAAIHWLFCLIDLVFLSLKIKNQVV